MPFQSEKQRRYLWANEPEIARDWTDTYGSGIAKALGGRIGFQEGGYDWSSEDNPELLQKMNDAVDKAVNDYLGKIKSGEISFPDNLQLEIDKVGNKTRHDMIQSQSDQPEIFSETLQEGLDKSNIQQKQKRSIEQELLDEMNQTRLSDEDWLKEADARQLTADSGMFGTDATYVDKITPQTRGPMGDEMWARPNEGLASIGPHGFEYGNQWQKPPAKENWRANLKKYAAPAYNFMRGNVGAGLMGLVNPLAALTTMFAGRGQGIGNFANTMRGGLTQSGFERARDARRRQSRIDYMVDRRDAGKDWGVKQLNQLTMGSRPGFYGNEPTYNLPQKQRPKPPPPPTRVHHTGGNGGVNGGTSGGFSGAGAGTGSRGPRS